MDERYRYTMKDVLDNAVLYLQREKDRLGKEIALEQNIVNDAQKRLTAAQSKLHFIDDDIAEIYKAAAMLDMSLGEL